MKSRIQSAIRSGKLYKFILFLAISFIILLLSKLSKDYTKTVSFYVDMVNLPEERVIIKDSTHKLDLVLKTYGFKLLRYYLSNPRLTIDATQVNDIGGNYIWTSSKNLTEIKAQFASNVEIERANQDSLLFDYDVNYVKKVPVVLIDNIKFAPGFNITQDFILVPDSVRLIGPRAVVDSIPQILTDTLVLVDVKTNLIANLDLQLPQQIETIAMSSKTVRIEGNVDKFTEGTLQVPVQIKNLPANMVVNYFPKKVSVVFNTALSNYESVSAEDFEVECDFKELTEQKTYLTPKIIKKPGLVRSAKINQAKIELIISQ
ncbi:MAG: YbbR-like domain-containing protein [Flavobacteriaceae bacterium]|nr:YbbR-like domain-containing protein [Flavobacteriaceae bacterium]